MPCFTGRGGFYKVSVDSRDKQQATFLLSWLLWGETVALGSGVAPNIPRGPTPGFTACVCTVIKTRDKVYGGEEKMRGERMRAGKSKSLDQ